MSHFVVESMVVAVVLSAAAVAQAQEAKPEATGTPPAAEAAPAPAATPVAPTPIAPTGDDSAMKVSSAEKDGVRFRFGVSGGIGFFTASDDRNSISCTYYGFDLRFGAQINNMFAVYGQPTFGYYTTGDAGALAAGGLLGTSVIGEVTIINHFFAGAGVGYTIYNSPAGISPILRVGGYPLMGSSKEKARRKGLMLGIDLRFTPLDGLNTIVMPTFNAGYEAF